MNATLESIVLFLDDLLGTAGFPDYPNALNGLQAEGSGAPSRVGAAVDASEEVVRAAVDAGVDLLLVHHGLFWDGLRPLTGRHYRKLSALVNGGLALYSSHLPLDAHPEVGNSILLARALELEEAEPFGQARGVTTGWMARAQPEERRSFQARVAAAVDGPVRLISGGPGTVERVAVVTGAAGSLVEEAAARGADTLVTGEGGHQTYAAAMELGINLYYAGHYATETFGVRALAQRIEERFGLPWLFLDHPSGL